MEVNLSSFLEEDDQVQQQEEQLHHSCSPNDVTIEEDISAPIAVSTEDHDGSENMQTTEIICYKVVPPMSTNYCEIPTSSKAMAF